MTKQVFITDKKERLLKGNFIEIVEQGVSVLELIVENDNNLYKAESEDFFECLTNIRIQLEQKGWFILCQGASKNVYPSGMSRQMSNGVSAYRFQLGRPCSMQDIVNIFESATIEEVDTVEAQKTNHQNWIKSLRSL